METLKDVTEGGVLFAKSGFTVSDLRQNIVLRPVARGHIERDVVEVVIAASIKEFVFRNAVVVDIEEGFTDSGLERAKNFSQKTLKVYSIVKCYSLALLVTSLLSKR